MMKSIVSGGGPLVCVEHEIASLWRGIYGTCTQPAPADLSLNDYQRACNVSEYIGRIALGKRSALILGDMPLETLIWRPLRSLPVVVRVYYGDPGEDVIELIESVGGLDFHEPDEVLRVEFTSPKILIFDSAFSGSQPDIASLSFEVPVGKYLAVTKRLNLNERTSILAHSFSPEH